MIQNNPANDWVGLYLGLQASMVCVTLIYNLVTDLYMKCVIGFL